MLEKGKISLRQFTVLVLLYTVGSTILIIPSILTSVAKQDAWIAGFIGLGGGVVAVFLYSSLASKFPGKNFSQILEQLLGKWVGKTVSLVYLLTFVFLLCLFVLRDIGDFMVSVMMVETPIEVIHFTFLVVVIFAVRQGLETLSRTAELFLPWTFFLFLILVFAVSPHIDFNAARPVMEFGLKPVLNASISFLTFPFLELIVFLMIIPYVNTQHIRKGFLTGTLIGGGSLILISILSILVLGVVDTSESVYSSYDLAKQINLGGFIQRVEAMMAFLWFTTVFMKLTILTYVVSLGLAQTLELHDHKVLTLPLALIMYVFSIDLFPNISFLIEFTQTMQIYVLIYGAVFPIILIILSNIRQVRSLKPKENEAGT
ncbi:spore gernimation protein [Bacillus sp. BHET2]|uniref:GerAB/ArcD/ProY family transporter n=1 Tax=Bacillus sp. BHET2 TaxID=2583818 RepID=UPI00110D4A47|nr:endospore germination permease [Bacillus sp. BHET2]TMU87245.1 spore gernimation protein [Bacillus sp. BHET2]